MATPTYRDLRDEDLISDETLHRLEYRDALNLISVHWELKLVLYIGVTMLSTGLGILIYKNIDSISHQVVLAAIAALCAGCFYWSFKHKAPFSRYKAEAADSFTDYLVLLGVLSFLIFVGYLQFQFEVFGTRYGLATFIPMLVLFFVAYYYDHLGVLTMAIANLGVWLGVSVTPKRLIAANTFDNERVLYTYLVLGLLLLSAAWASERFNFKKHFFFSYHHYGLHIAFVALVSGYFYYSYALSFFWLLGFAALAWYAYQDALSRNSYYLLMITVIYSYIIVSGLVVWPLTMMNGEGALYIGLIYFIVSGAGFVNLLMSLGRKVKKA